jgi:biotin transporter BioY
MDGKVKFLRWVNLFPLVMFVIRDLLGMPDINPMWLLVVAAFGIMNVFVAKSMKEYLLLSLLLLISSVVGMLLGTCYYYYFCSSDFETPIVGTVIAIIYGIFVLVLAGVGSVVFAFKNRKES